MDCREAAARGSKDVHFVRIKGDWPWVSCLVCSYPQSSPYQPSWRPEHCEKGSRTAKDQHRGSPQPVLQQWLLWLPCFPLLFPRKKNISTVGQMHLSYLEKLLWPAMPNSVANNTNKYCMGNTRNRVHLSWTGEICKAWLLSLRQEAPVMMPLVI